MIPLLTVALTAAAYYSPAEAQAMVGDAKAAAQRGNFAAAADEYRRLADHGLGTPDVLYNLGTAELRAGQAAAAARDLERARVAGAGGSDLAANLERAQRQSGQTPSHSLWRTLSTHRLRNAAAFFAAALFGLALLIATGRRLQSVRRLE